MSTDTGFAKRLIDWQRRAGRHHLPWQNTRDVYRIWLSEIMLQQTQVAAVIPYYVRFLEHFPDLASLAAAPLDEVMRHWSGLGYYSRARNLHACAQRVVSGLGGVFPDDPEAIAQLPGIGRSTAAAIAVFAHGRRAAILDGNVKRVLCRVFAVSGYPGERVVEQRLWMLAQTLLPKETKRIEDYTQGLMDLGATLCKPKNADCAQCPMRVCCEAHAQGRVHELPTPKPRKALPERTTILLVLRHRHEVLIERRAPLGIWGGLWSLPETDMHDGEAAAHTFARPYGKVSTISAAPAFVHVFTHFRLTAQPLIVTLARRAPLLADSDSSRQWMALNQLARVGLPAPVKKFLASL